MIKLPTKDQIKRVAGYSLVILSATPPVFAAVGAFWPPAAAAGLAIQEFLHFFNTVQPGFVQGVAAYSGAKLLSSTKPAEPKG